MTITKNHFSLYLLQLKGLLFMKSQKTYQVSTDSVTSVNISANPKDKNCDERNLSEDVDSDIVSNFTGHFGLWQFCWTFILSLFQIPAMFHIFSFTFQVKVFLFYTYKTYKTLTMTFGSTTAASIHPIRLEAQSIRDSISENAILISRPTSIK